MLNINNSACASTSRAESKDSQSLDSAIFAQQKSNKMCSTQVHTDTRPCRGGKNALKKCSSAFLAFLTRQGKSEALPPKDILLAAEKTQRVASAAQQKQRRFILFGALASGEGINPFSFCANKRF
ncbi:hypothetical protein [uncultured Helicobacter sp.]|uniref:hypothetical protein n=1 Tax=uncultured Helicobacter sp. TaxID=175537 RepID=UPI003751D270